MLIAASPLALAVSMTSRPAHADVGKPAASGTGKGIVGGALLGGELVCGVEAIAGVRSPWAYVGGAIGGAAAGGVGGYFVEHNASARVSMILLAGGMTFAIPTLVGVLSATAYQPPADYLLDKPPADEPLANPPQPDAASAPPPAPLVAPTNSSSPAPNPAPPQTATPPVTQPQPTPAPTTTPPTSSLPRAKHYALRRSEHLPPLLLTPPSLVAVRPGTLLALNVPAVEIENTYTRAELAMYGVKQTTEVHIPVLNVVF
jgi:hypothetical protein